MNPELDSGVYREIPADNETAGNRFLIVDIVITYVSSVYVNLDTICQLQRSSYKWVFKSYKSGKNDVPVT